MPINEVKPSGSGIGSLFSMIQAIYGGGSGSLTSMFKGKGSGAGVAAAPTAGVSAGAETGGLGMSTNLGGGGPAPAPVNNAVDRALSQRQQSPDYLIHQGLQALKDPNYGPNLGITGDDVMAHHVTPLLEAFHYKGPRPEMQDSLSPDEETGYGAES